METEIEFGRINRRGSQLFNTTEYICNDGHQIIGDTIRHCSYSGTWNGTKPYCVSLRYLERIYTIIVISVTCASAMLIFAIIIFVCRNNLNLVFNVNEIALYCLCMSDKRKETLYLTYSSLDHDQVQNEILPTMKSELSSWNILTYQEDFIGGEKVLECIHRAIWNSRAVIAFLTPNYVQSLWCRYEFAEGQTRSARDRQFRFIVILPNEVTITKTDILNGLPEIVRIWISGRVYLTVGESLFWEKLRRGLSG